VGTRRFRVRPRYTGQAFFVPEAVLYAYEGTALGSRQRGRAVSIRRYRLDIVIWPWSNGPVHVVEPV